MGDSAFGTVGSVRSLVAAAACVVLALPACAGARAPAPSAEEIDEYRPGLRLVPLSFSQDYARRLRAAGHPVDLVVVPGAGHHEIYAADVIGQRLGGWIAAQ